MPKWPPVRANAASSIRATAGEMAAFLIVCTNNDLLNPDVAVEIAHRALDGKIEPIRRAIHLEFNYRGPRLNKSD